MNLLITTLKIYMYYKLYKKNDYMKNLLLVQQS